MKNNLKYFRHVTDAYRDGKFKMLRKHYGEKGWEMDAKFWVLNSLIAEASDCWLNLSKKYDLTSAAEEMNLENDELRDFIKFLEDEAELIVSDKNCITTKIVQETLGKVKGNRDRQQRWRDTQKIQAKLEVRDNPDTAPEIPAESKKIPAEELKVVLNAIMEFFGFNEVTNFNHMRDIRTMLILASNSIGWPSVKIQVRDYITLKRKTGKPHSFKNWLGTRDEKYLNGAWNSENWTQKLMLYKKDETGDNGAEVKSKTETVKFDY